jgi:hypothetical protein
LPEGGVVRGDDEVCALGELAAAAVGRPVDGGEDRLAQLADRVEGAIEVLALAQPVLLVMFLRWRRSLPTENARSPAPVRITARTAVRTAIVSTISVRRAPISVVIALSAWGRLRVISATWPSER